MTGGPSAAFYRGNWMKMNKQKTQHRWRKAAAGLLALLLSFGMACSAFAETAVGAGALRKSAAAGVQMVDAGTQDAAAQVRQADGAEKISAARHFGTGGKREPGNEAEPSVSPPDAPRLPRQVRNKAGYHR